MLRIRYVRLRLWFNSYFAIIPSWEKVSCKVFSKDGVQCCLSEAYVLTERYLSYLAILRIISVIPCWLKIWYYLYEEVLTKNKNKILFMYERVTKKTFLYETRSLHTKMLLISKSNLMNVIRALRRTKQSIVSSSLNFEEPICRPKTPILAVRCILDSRKTKLIDIDDNPKQSIFISGLGSNVKPLVIVGKVWAI